MSANSCGLNPFRNQVVVEPEIEEATTNGIIIPATSEGKPVRGKVIAAGPGELSKDGQLIPLSDVKVGSTVMFRKYAGTEFEHNRKTYLVLRADDLIGEVI